VIALLKAALRKGRGWTGLVKGDCLGRLIALKEIGRIGWPCWAHNCVASTLSPSRGMTRVCFPEVIRPNKARKVGLRIWQVQG
jgi:hypothetical protein